MPERDLVARVRAAASDDVWHYHSRVSTQHRYIAVAVPKVACTTIKRTLHELEGLPRTERLVFDHEAGEQMRLARFGPKKVAGWLTSSDWFKFTFVRNPYDRLLSAWKSKILDPRDQQYAPVRDRIRHAFGYPARDDAPVVAFGDFVRFVTSKADPAMSADGHWERQTIVGRHDLIPYDFVGRFESFGNDLGTVLGRLAAPASVRALAEEVTNPSSDIPMAAAYDSELAAIVYDYYRDDFDAFGYERESWLSR